MLMLVVITPVFLFHIIVGVALFCFFLHSFFFGKGLLCIIDRVFEKFFFLVLLIKYFKAKRGLV